jgi:capsular polysaccharide export protein
MSKLSKLMRDPNLFLTDMLAKRTGNFQPKSEIVLQEETLVWDVNEADYTTVITLVFGFSPWKSFLRDWFPDRKLVFFPKAPTPVERISIIKKMQENPATEIFVWGLKCDPEIISAAKRIGNRINYIEDGFIRSVALGATKTPPLSLCIDATAPYFTSRTETDLENILNTYNFSENPKLLARAEKVKKYIVDFGLSKYNNAPSTEINDIYGPKSRKRILVVGQVEDDASILHGCKKGYKNNDIVFMAALENPNAQIIYKPHPDVLAKHRPEQSDPKDVEHIAQVLTQSISLADSFHGVDHVYTITSLAGFEALLRGIRVTCLGAPFYSGWGVTDDRQDTPRRTRSLSVNEIFAAAYILYPHYLDPIKRERIEVEEAIELLIKLRALEAKKDLKEADESTIESAATVESQFYSDVMRQIDHIREDISKLEATLRYNARPCAGEVGVALRRLGWTRIRDWSKNGGGRRIWRE